MRDAAPILRDDLAGCPDGKALDVAWRNRRILGVLLRLARRFREAGVDLMAVKGAALQLTLYRRAWDRPMGDLDVLVRPGQLPQAMELVRQCGGMRTQTLMAPGFFPRYYYEAQYTFGQTSPVVMDLHVRPWRPLRYARLVPDDGLWSRAVTVDVAGTPVTVPEPGDMLLHLAVHLAIHGCRGERWSRDLALWVQRYGAQIDWDRLVATAQQWRLTLPLLAGLHAGQAVADSPLLPDDARVALTRAAVNWQDRLALWQAPRDNEHPVAHVAVAALTTPGWRFVGGYLKACLLPDRRHMREWYPHEHRGWLALAHLLRWTGPAWRWTQPWTAAWRKVEVASDEHGPRLVAATRIEAGVTICRATPRRDRASEWTAGDDLQHVLGGIAGFARPSSSPTATWDGRRLVALRALRPGQGVTIAAPAAPRPPQGLTTTVERCAA